MQNIYIDILVKKYLAWKAIVALVQICFKIILCGVESETIYTKKKLDFCIIPIAIIKFQTKLNRKFVSNFNCNVFPITKIASQIASKFCDSIFQNKLWISFNIISKISKFWMNHTNKNDLELNLTFPYKVWVEWTCKQESSPKTLNTPLLTWPRLRFFSHVLRNNLFYILQLLQFVQI